jgi:TonB family protein
MKFSRPWFAISVIAHAAAIALFLWAGIQIVSKSSGGAGGSAGEVISVWLSGPSGSVISGVDQRLGFQTLQKARPQKFSDDEASFEKVKSSKAGGGAGGKAGEGVGGGTLSSAGLATGDDETLRLIWKMIDKKKYYPQTARKQGIIGAPKVSFALDETGNIAWLKIEESCGRQILDEAAIETVKRSAPLPYYPTTITLSIKYSLDSQF